MVFTLNVVWRPLEWVGEYGPLRKILMSPGSTPRQRTEAARELHRLLKDVAEDMVLFGEFAEKDIPEWYNSALKTHVVKMNATMANMTVNNEKQLCDTCITALICFSVISITRYRFKSI